MLAISPAKQETATLSSVEFRVCRVQVVFGLNALYNRSRLDSGTWGPWDSSNARDFIKFTVEQGIAVEGWELGNHQTLNHEGL